MSTAGNRSVSGVAMACVRCGIRMSSATILNGNPVCDLCLPTPNIAKFSGLELRLQYLEHRVKMLEDRAVAQTKSEES